MEDPTEAPSPGRAALIGGLSGAGVGTMLSGVAWVLLGLVAVVFGVGLFLCMGAANLMSVNNSTTGDLIRGLPEMWWDLFGDFFTVLAMLVAGAGGLLFVGCVVAGVASGWTWTRIVALARRGRSE